MRIGMDLTSLTEHHSGGKEKFIQWLLHGWRDHGWDDELTLFVYPYRAQQVQGWAPNARVVVVPERHIKFRAQIFRTLELPEMCRREALDFLYFPHPETGLRKFSIPSAVTPHDIQFIEYPERQNWYGRWKTKLLYGVDFWLRDGIAAISDYDYNAMANHYPRHAGKVKRIYNPVVISERIPETTAVPSAIMTVNIGFAHKNVETIVKAYERIHQQISHQLVLVGPIRPETRYVEELVNKSPAVDRIQLTGYVSEKELEDLYDNCAVFVTASTYEGFGMTTAEAMGRGIPVVCSRAAALPETTFHSACYYEPADDADSLAEKLLQVIHSPPEKSYLSALKKRVKETYDYQIIAARYRNWFLDLYNTWTCKNQDNHD